MKKALRNIVLFTLFFSLIVLVSFAKHEQEKTLVRNVIVSIDITQGDPFMDQNDIRDLVYSRQDTLMGKPLSSLHLEEVEKLLEEQTAVKSAEVYTGHNGDVHLEITLKKVIARIKPDSTSGFYVDDNGGTMEWTSKYSPRVLLVTGHLSQYNRFLKDTLVNKDVINHTKLINDVYAFAEYVRKDSFWRSQIGQVYINEKGDAVLGNRTRVKVVKNKVAPPFRQVEFDIFYGKGISKVGEVIDLATENKIVSRAGSWYSYGETRIGQGRDNAKQYLLDNPEMYQEIEKKVRTIYELPVESADTQKESKKKSK